MGADAAAGLLVGHVGLPGGRGWPDPRGLRVAGSAENATFAAAGLESGMRMITEPCSVETLAARAPATIAGRD